MKKNSIKVYRDDPRSRSWLSLEMKGSGHGSAAAAAQSSRKRDEVALRIKLGSVDIQLKGIAGARPGEVAEV